MIQKIFDLIDNLLDMSGNEKEYEEIKENMSKVDEKILNIQSLREEIKEKLKNKVNYYDDVNEMLDKNIELSLNKKIDQFTKINRQKSNNLRQLKNQEQKQQQLIDLKEKELINSENFLNLLKESSTGGEISIYLQNQTKKLAKLKQELKSIKDEHDLLQTKILNLTKEIQTINEELLQNNHTLTKIRENLVSKDKYINKIAKEKDEEYLQELEEELKFLENEKLNLQKEPVYLVKDLKQKIQNQEDVFPLLSQFYTTIETLPYLNYESKDLLTEELKKLENEAEQTITLIENPQKSHGLREIIKKRIEYLTEHLETLNGKLKTKYDKIQELEQKEIEKIFTNLNESENLTQEIEKTLKKLVESKEDNRSSYIINIVENNYQQQKEQLMIVQKIVDNYYQEVTKIFQKIKAIKQEEIFNLQSEIKSCQTEKEYLEKLNIDSSLEDLGEVEVNKKKLKELNEKIKFLKINLKYSHTPKEIYQEIITLLSKPAEENLDLVKPQKKPSEYSFEKISLPAENMIKNIESGEEPKEGNYIFNSVDDSNYVNFMDAYQPESDEQK